MVSAEVGSSGHVQATEHDAVVTGGRMRRLRGLGRLCLGCGERRARYQYRGVVKADHTHTLCFECFRAERNRLRGRTMFGGGWLAPLASAPPRASKTFGDREALYLDLQRRRRRAVLVAYHASGAATAVAPQPVRDDQDCSKGSVHCAVSSSSAADAVIESTGASAA